MTVLTSDSTRLLAALILATILSLHGRRKKSLSRSGSLAAFVVGFISFGVSYRFGCTLILFYLSSSRLTRYRADEKARIEADFEESSERGAIQVFCCSIIGCIIALCYAAHRDSPSGSSPSDSAIAFSADPTGSWLLAAYLGHYACCAGDTWASELGVLDPFGDPRLVLCPWRKVPRGTNGGVSPTGLAASAAGGAFMGLSYSACGRIFVGPNALQLAPMVALGTFGGLAGSLLDSALGQTLQTTWYCRERKCVVKAPRDPVEAHRTERVCGVDVLSNTQVNLISATLTSLASAWFAQTILRMD
jgi:uncharacterized protein (TIGR00297 family)